MKDTNQSDVHAENLKKEARLAAVVARATEELGKAQTLMQPEAADQIDAQLKNAEFMETTIRHIRGGFVEIEIYFHDHDGGSQFVRSIRLDSIDATNAVN